MVAYETVKYIPKEHLVYKNWQAISKEPDELFRFLLFTTNDKRILAGLETGFPEFFHAEEQPLRIPLSIIKAWREEGEEGLPLDTVLGHFGIPYFEFGGEAGKEFPEEWVTTLGDRNIWFNASDNDCSELVYVSWHGKRCLVADRERDNSTIILVPEEFIDVSA